MSGPSVTAVPVLVMARGRACPLCDTPAGQACQPRPEGDHLARYLDACTAGQLTKAYMAMVLGELVVVDACAVIERGEPGTGRWAGEVTRRVVHEDEPTVPSALAPKPNGPDGFTCDCGARLPWPSKAEDVTYPSCGTAWEHDGVASPVHWSGKAKRRAGGAR